MAGETPRQAGMCSLDKMNVSQLEGQLLDYWVARAMGYSHSEIGFLPPAVWADIKERALRIVVIKAYGYEVPD